MTQSARFLSAVVIRGSAIGFSLLVTVVLTRVLTPEDFGRYVFVQSVIVIASVTLDAGLPNLVVREVAANDQAGKRGLVKGIIVWALRFAILFSGFLLFLGFAFGQTLFSVLPESGVSTSTEADLLTIGLLSLPFIGMLGVFSGGLRAFQRDLAGQILSLSAARACNLVLLGLAVAFSVFGKLDVMLALIIFATSFALTSAVAAILLWFQSDYAWTQVTSEYESRSWFSSLLPLTLIAGLQVIVAKTDIIMLRALAGPNEVGAYHVANQLANLTYIAKSGVLLTVAPRFARAYRSGDMKALQFELTAAARFVFLIGLPLALLLIFFGEPLIEIVFGANFRVAYPAVIILSIGYVTLAMFGAVDMLFKMTNNERLLLISTPFAFALNVGLNFYLIPIYGLAGAAAATAVSLLAWRFGLVLVAYRKLGLLSFAFYPSHKKDAP